VFFLIRVYKLFSGQALWIDRSIRLVYPICRRRLSPCAPASSAWRRRSVRSRLWFWWPATGIGGSGGAGSMGWP